MFSPFLPIVQLSPLVSLLFSFRPIFPYCLVFASCFPVFSYRPLFPYCSVFAPFLPIFKLSPLISVLFSFRPLFPYCLVFAPYSPTSLYLNNIVECRSQTYSHNYQGLNERHSFYSSIIFIATPPSPSSSSSGKGERFDVLMNRVNFFYYDNLILRSQT